MIYWPFSFEIFFYRMHLEKTPDPYHFLLAYSFVMENGNAELNLQLKLTYFATIDELYRCFSKKEIHEISLRERADKVWS